MDPSINLADMKTVHAIAYRTLLGEKMLCNWETDVQDREEPIALRNLISQPLGHSRLHPRSFGRQHLLHSPSARLHTSTQQVIRLRISPILQSLSSSIISSGLALARAVTLVHSTVHQIFSSDIVVSELFTSVSLALYYGLSDAISATGPPDISSFRNLLSDPRRESR